MRLRSRLVAPFMALIVVGSVGGCARIEQPDLGLPEKNISRWVMPLDSYAQTEEQISTVYFAWTLTAVGCMRESGYDVQAPPRAEPPLSDKETWNSVGRALFDPEIASVYGYRSGPDPDLELAAEWNKFKRSEYSDSEKVKLRECQTAAWKKLPDYVGEDSLIREYQVTASEAAQEDDAVKAATEAWRACMIPLGIPDLEDSPADMPSTSQLQRFGLAEDVAGANLAMPGIQEVEEAVVDAECRDYAGYGEALYSAEWDQQVSSLGDGQVEIAAVKQKFEQVDQAARAIIAANAPAS